MSPVPPLRPTCRRLHSVGAWFISLSNDNSRLPATPCVHVYGVSWGQHWQGLCTLIVVLLLAGNCRFCILLWRCCGADCVNTALEHGSVLRRTLPINICAGDSFSPCHRCVSSVTATLDVGQCRSALPSSAHVFTVFMALSAIPFEEGKTWAGVCEFEFPWSRKCPSSHSWQMGHDHSLSP